MNKLDFHLVDDPREKALRDAVYRSIGRLVDNAAGDASTTRDASMDPASAGQKQLLATPGG
jgi:hypothetical protein